MHKQIDVLFICTRLFLCSKFYSNEKLMNGRFVLQFETDPDFALTGEFDATN